PVNEEPDNSYHPGWFAGLAQEFGAAIAQGVQGPLAQQNLQEAAAALAMLSAAKASNASGGVPTRLPRLRSALRPPLSRLAIFCCWTRQNRIASRRFLASAASAQSL